MSSFWLSIQADATFSPRMLKFRLASRVGLNFEGVPLASAELTQITPDIQAGKVTSFLVPLFEAAARTSVGFRNASERALSTFSSLP